MLTITTKTQQLIPIVMPAGRIDSTNCDEFQQALQPLVEKANFLIVDLSLCDYLSSAGLRIFLLYEKKLISRGGGLFLSGLLPEVFQVIEMSGLNKVFHLFKDIESARSEIERLKLMANVSVKWMNGSYSFEFRPLENQREAALLWKSQGIAGYNELGFSVGIGSSADTSEEDKRTRGVFITTGGCAGFIPGETKFSSDFRIPQNPATAGIFVNQALSFGQQPMGIVQLSEPATLTLGQLADSFYPMKHKFSSGQPDLTAMVVANFNVSGPSVSLFLVVDQEMVGLLNMPESGELPGLSPGGSRRMSLWGARFMLSHIPDVGAGFSLNSFLVNALTIENIIDTEIAGSDNLVENPVTWLFISNGVADISTRRLLIETEDNFNFEPHKAFLARRLYTDASRLIVKQIHGGYSAQTFQVSSFDSEGRKLRPTVLKIADRAMISRESDRCKRFANPYILNNSAMVLGTEFFGNTGALRYNFVGIGGEQTKLKWLTHYFHHWPTEQLEPLFDKIFLQILHPWYGQPIQEVIHPFHDHDPRSTFFPQLCEAASDQLSVSADEQFFTVEETGQELINPYWFLKHEFARLRETAIDYYTSVCHGDLNMQNILLDEDMNVYLIDFSETRPRSLVSDFARLEAIFMIEHAPLETQPGREEYIRFISRFYDSVKLDFPPVNDYEGEHRDKVNRNISLTLKMRGYALNGVKGDPNPVPYCLALLEWILPVVCYSTTPVAHKRLSMIVAGLLCKNIINAG